MGYYLILRCIRQALKYEHDHLAGKVATPYPLNLG
jgi:hypothetical protein